MLKLCRDDGNAEGTVRVQTQACKRAAQIIELSELIRKKSQNIGALEFWNRRRGHKGKKKRKKKKKYTNREGTAGTAAALGFLY
jgi:hypothetical protein